MTDNSSMMALPNFLYVGAARSASTYIYQVLKEHPEIFTPPVKDLYFFNRNYAKGLSWYAGFFKEAEACKAAGEFTMDYFVDPVCAERIKKDIPGCKILFCLREPVERAFDHYYWERLTFHYVSRKEFQSGLSFIDFARKPEILALGNYYENMKAYYQLFPGDNILVLFMDELYHDNRAFVQKIYEFLGVSGNFIPPSLDKRVNKLRIARFPLLTEMGYRFGNHLRNAGRPGLVSALRDLDWFNRLMFKPVNKDARILREAIPVLWPLYHQHDRALTDMINRPLPRSWQADNYQRAKTN